MSADTLVPGYENPQHLNRYSYVENNPISYTDPTGHMRTTDETGNSGCSNPKYCNHGNPMMGGSNKKKGNNGGKLCEWVPKACQGGKWNPLTYDTVGAEFEFDLKLGGGIEIKPFVLVNGNDLRNLDWENAEAAAGVSIEVSSGLSVEGTGGLTITGSDGGVLDQASLQPPNFNAGGCIHTLACPKVSGSYSFAKQSLTSIGYSWRGGKGVDLSVGQPENFIVAYGDNNKGWIKIPGFPKLFPLDFESPIQ